MGHDKTAVCISRRRFITASAGLAALGLAPAGATAWLRGDPARPPRAWLGWWNDQPGSGMRAGPVPVTRRAPQPDLPLVLHFRGPWLLADGTAPAGLHLDLRYRECPGHPFTLWSDSPGAPACNQRLHACAAAPAELCVSRAGCDRGARCELTELTNPTLAPGHYLVVIDTRGDGPEPDWHALRLDATTGRISAPGAHRSLAVLGLNVTAA